MINLAELVILAAASYRSTQLVVHDAIGDPFRDRIIAWQQARDTSPVRTAVVTLMSCTYCSGWWLAGMILAVYLHATDQWNTTPLLLHGVEWLAVAGGQALLNRVDDSMESSR